jgi:hypothetical protein
MAGVTEDQLTKMLQKTTDNLSNQLGQLKTTVEQQLDNLSNQLERQIRQVDQQVGALERQIRQVDCCYSGYDHVIVGPPCKPVAPSPPLRTGQAPWRKRSCESQPYLVHAAKRVRNATTVECVRRMSVDS